MDKKYAFLFDEPGPKMLIEALKLIGVREIAGRLNDPIIMAMAKFLGIDNIYKNDETAWCGLAMGYIIVRAEKVLPFKGYDILRAKKYLEFGQAIPIAEAMLGDVLVFDRPGGQHVAGYAAESKTTFHVWGGNQSNSFSFTEIAKSRCIGARRPHYNVMPANIRKIFMDSTGKVSTNES